MKPTMIIGLTGSIGMGKSTVAKMFSRRGIPVFSADHAVHDLLKTDKNLRQKIARAFPAARMGDNISRAKLGAIVFNNDVARQDLEKLLHPAVFKAADAFVRDAKKVGKSAVVLDIPLLFETGAEKKMDYVLCVWAPKAIQRARVLARPGMTAKKFIAICARQMKDSEKKARADFVIPTGVPIEQTRRVVQDWIQQLKQGRL